MSEQSSSLEANKNVIRSFWQDVYNEGRLDVVDKLVTKDHVLRVSDRPEPKIGRDMLKGKVVLIREILHNINVEFDGEMIAEGDKVVSRWMASGTLSPKLKAVGVTGEEVRLSGLSIFHMSDGRIKETRLWLEALQDEIPVIREEVRKELLKNEQIKAFIGEANRDWFVCRMCHCC